MDRPSNREITRQEFLSIGLTVLVTPTRLSSGAQQSAIQLMYETIAFSNPFAGVNSSVWIGGANVSATLKNGQEVISGGTVVWRIRNERQLYEIQGPIVDKSCQVPELIPFMAWDVSQIYLVAAVQTTIGVTLFKGSLF